MADEIAEPENRQHSLWLNAMLALLLVLVTAAAFWPSAHYGFVNFDDRQNVVENWHVRGGISGDGIRWAWSNLDAGYYVPVMWMTLMADAGDPATQPPAASASSRTTDDDLDAGINATRFHRTNVLLHAANAALLFLFLQMLTRATLRCLLVAALFAVHPLRVESVAWVTERKDVLSAFFGLLSLLVYVGYVQRRSVSSYLLCILTFALSLLSKPMLLMFPFLLLLLDHWPLARTTPGIDAEERQPAIGWARAVVEKIPFFLLAGGALVLSVLGEYRAGAIGMESSVAGKLANLAPGHALVAYAAYIVKLLVPISLCCFYPIHPLSPLQVAGAAGLLVALSGLALWRTRRWPWLLLGWGWYLLLLLPMSGLLRLGDFSMADRFTYFPTIGLFIMLVWSLPPRWLFGEMRVRPPGSRQPEVAPGVPWLPGLAVGAACLVWLGLLLALTRKQLTYWANSRLLFQHALAVSGPSSTAYINLGQVDADEGQLGDAIRQFKLATDLDPASGEAHYNIGVTLYRLGRWDDAEAEFRRAIGLLHNPARAYYNLGVMLAARQRPGEALDAYRRAAEADPSNPDFHLNYGALLLRQGKFDQAEAQERISVRMNPRDYQARMNLGMALLRQRNLDEAAEQYQAAMRLRPDFPLPREIYATILAQRGDLEGALAILNELLRVHPDFIPAQRSRQQVVQAMQASQQPPRQ